MLTYVARTKTGRYGADDLEATKIDMLIEGMSDIANKHSLAMSVVNLLL